MEIVADGLMVFSALMAGVYCLVLSNRLKNFTDRSSGLGGLIAELSQQVENLNDAFSDAISETEKTSNELALKIERGESAIKNLELLLASLHDIPPQKDEEKSIGPVFSHKHEDKFQKSWRR